VPKYWIIAVSEDNWEIINKENIYGAPETSGVRSPTQLIEPGDVVIFYVKMKGSKKLGGKFVGAYEVISSWYREDKPLWSDEVREGKVKYPWRIKLRPIKIGIAEFKELVPKLKFIEKKDRAQAYLVGTPANLRRPIPEEDVRTILNSMK